MENKRSLMKKVFSLADSEGRIRTNVLVSKGINQSAISHLQSCKRIEWLGRGIYQITSNSYYIRGLEYLSKGDRRKANADFKKSYELDSTNPDINFIMFFESVDNGSLKNVLMYFSAMRKTRDEEYQGDCNFYLFLLSFLIELPKEYREEVTAMRHSDMSQLKAFPNDRRFENPRACYQARLNVFRNGDFESAYKTFCEEKNGKKVSKISRILLKKILVKKQRYQEQKAANPVEVTASLICKEISANGLEGSAKILLSEYLRRIGREDYLPVLISQIEECAVAGDAEYGQVQDSLSKLSKGEYVISWSEYKSAFNKMIANRDYDGANALLRILRNRNNIGGEDTENIISSLSSIRKQVVATELDKKPYLMDKIKEDER